MYAQYCKLFSLKKIFLPHITPETNRRAINTFGLAWGFQRNFQNRFSLDLNLGGGYLYTKATTINDAGQFISKNAGQFTTVGQLNLGLWLNKRN